MTSKTSDKAMLQPLAAPVVGSKPLDPPVSWGQGADGEFVKWTNVLWLRRSQLPLSLRLRRCLCLPNRAANVRSHKDVNPPSSHEPAPGTLLVVGNYTGDILNAGLAITKPPLLDIMSNSSRLEMTLQWGGRREERSGEGAWVDILSRWSVRALWRRAVKACRSVRR
jgi:hypothetical protein